MGQPVKLSDSLVLDARQIGELEERSIAGQIEFWARIGQAVEPLLSGTQVRALRRFGAEQSLVESVGTIDSDVGRKRVADYLATQPFPHYEVADGRPGYLVRIEANGKRTIGKFVKGEFRKAPSTVEKSPTRRRP